MLLIRGNPPRFCGDQADQFLGFSPCGAKTNNNNCLFNRGGGAVTAACLVFILGIRQTAVTDFW